VALLADQLAEVTAEGHQALVFSTFTSFLARVRARLEADGIPTVQLDGTTRDRGAVIEAFRRAEAPVFLISLKAGGVGLTLTEADYVYVLDPWWNPAAEAQAVDRAHRIGQDKHVHVYRLVATDTIEEKVMALKARKADLFARVIDGDGAAAPGITADDIRGLFDDG
jgi:SNF2 family DNA or RNA helicase